MKKNVIAVIMSLMMAAGSVGGTQALASETTAAEAMEIAQDEEIVEPEKIDENEDTDTGSTDEASEDEIIQEEPEQETEEGTAQEEEPEQEEEPIQETEDTAEEATLPVDEEEDTVEEEAEDVGETEQEESADISEQLPTDEETLESDSGSMPAELEEAEMTEDTNEALGAVQGSEIVAYARQYTGRIPYVWGGGSNKDVSALTSGTDCSGFVCGVFYHFGINLWPYRTAIRNSPLVSKIGADIANAQPGDIIHWAETTPGSGNGHVAIYAGDGWMVHETTSSYNGVSSNVLYTPVSLVAANRPISGIYRVSGVVGDTEKPVVRNARITDVTKDGYTVICDVSDNVGVTRVTFPTWTDADWQDDIVWKDGTISNGTATFRVNISDHGNQYGKYLTYIYASDAAGNVSVETDATRLSVELYDQAPKTPTITVSKSHYLPSDTIRIRANANGATSYYGAIYRLGKRIWEGSCQSGGIIEYPASQFGQGEYSAYVTCSNNAGWVDTKWVNYTVPYDMGNDFYAYIILKKDWKHLGVSGTNVEIASANDSFDPKQIWRFVKQPNDNSYIAYNMYMSGYENAEWVLSCHNSGSSNQTNIEVAKNQNLSSQKWFLYIYDDQFKLVPGHCSLCMDAADGGTSSGANIRLYEYNGTYAQGYSVYSLSTNNRIYTRPGKPSASVYTGPAKTDAGKTVTLTWSESAKVNSFDKRSYRLQVFDSNGKSVLNQSGLTALNYNYNFNTPGTYSVQITAVNDYYMEYETAGSKAQIIVNEAVKDLKNLTITGIANKTYTGKNITQAVVVKDGDKTLIAGTDYTVTYKNNKNVGTATVIITGNGSYTGTVEKTFKITAKKITPTLVLSNTTFTYNGAVQMPDETVKDGKTVLAKSNYDISWPAGCVDPGKYSVTVTLKGNYSGTATGTFTILPGKTSRGDMFNLANNVKVTWKEVSGAKYYKVYREGVTDPSESLDEPVIVTERLIGWDTQPGLTNGHAYRYKIVASLTGKGDSSGDSPLSYSKLMYRLKTVVIRSVKNTEPGKVTVKYDRTTSGDSYVLQYCEREDMVGAKTKVVLGASNTSYTIGGLKKGKTYYISIRVRKKVDGIDYYTTFGVAKKITVTK